MTQDPASRSASSPRPQAAARRLPTAPAPPPSAYAPAAPRPELEVGTALELIEALKRCFRDDPRGCRAAALLRAYTAGGTDWHEYAFFEEGAYTRNLLERNAEFELLLLCWGPGQTSPIHNHEGQNCWAAVVEGPLEEVRYQLRSDGAPGPPAEDGPVLRYESGEVMFIRDDIALHAVRATAGGRAASLHLYARPYAECNVYCEATGRVTRMRLADFSVRGQRLG